MVIEKELHTLVEDNSTTSADSNSSVTESYFNSLVHSSNVTKRSTSTSTPYNCKFPFQARPSRAALNMFYNETGNECRNTLTLYNKCDCKHRAQE